VVTTDVGGCAAMVEHGVSGLVVPPRDGAALAGALAALLADPQRGARMGRAAHKAARARFRLEPVVKKTLGVYAEVMGGRHPERVHESRVWTKSGQSKDARASGGGVK